MLDDIKILAQYFSSDYGQWVIYEFSTDLVCLDESNDYCKEGGEICFAGFFE